MNEKVNSEFDFAVVGEVVVGTDHHNMILVAEVKAGSDKLLLGTKRGGVFGIKAAFFVISRLDGFTVNRLDSGEYFVDGALGNNRLLAATFVENPDEWQPEAEAWQRKLEIGLNSEQFLDYCRFLDELHGIR
jgi:hypothetical protein